MGTAEAPLRAAMVGLRNHAGTLEPSGSNGLLKSFRALPDVEVVAYCEWAPSEAAALAAIGAADPTAHIYSDLEALLAGPAFDLAVLMLPASEGIDAALRLAQAGKHLFIEKQVARSAAEVVPLQQIVADQGLVVHVNYPWPRHPVAQAIRQQIEAGTLGRLLAMEARLVTTQVRPGLREPHHWLYRQEGEGGGILHMEGGHWLTLFHTFSAAQVEAVTALCSQVGDYAAAGIEEAVTVALELTGGIHACLHMGYLLPGVGPRNDTYFGLRGTHGTISWPNMGEGTYTVASTTPGWAGAPVRTVAMDVASRPVYADQWGLECVAEFVAAVRGHGTPTVTLSDGYRVLQIIEACYASTREGRRVVLPPRAF